jgi:hypothetical protein
MKVKVVKIKKPKKKTRGKIVKELDSIFSRYIRMFYSDQKGICECYTCGAKDHYKNQQDGHFITRGNYKYRWDVDNNRVQCIKCNIFYNGNYKVYTLKMVDEYGREEIDRRLNDHELANFKTYELEEMIETYKILVKEQEVRL